MFRLPELMWIVATCASLVGQSPLSVSESEPQDCNVSASATPDELLLKLKVADGFHAYAHDVGGGGPVSIALDPSCGFVAAGPVRPPDDQGGKVFGEAVWRLPIRSNGVSGVLRATVWLQICDELMCHEPERVELSGWPGGVPVLLVCGSRDGRAARLEAFLGEQGMQATVVTYGDVTAQMCDRHAVVLCDSKRFRQTAKVRELVQAFPRTQTPIVAVGYFGTELIEAHGVAMTSGYI